jgi:hypothetical protein
VAEGYDGVPLKSVEGSEPAPIASKVQATVLGRHLPCLLLRARLSQEGIGWVVPDIGLGEVVRKLFSISHYQFDWI